MKKKLTIPYRPWHEEKFEPYVHHLGEELARDGMLAGMLGADFKVFVRYDPQAKRVVFSFRSREDQAEDDPADGWTQLR